MMQTKLIKGSIHPNIDWGYPVGVHTHCGCTYISPLLILISKELGGVVKKNVRGGMS